MCNINYPKIAFRICAKNVSETDKAVQCGFILNVTILNIQIRVIFKRTINPGIVQNVNSLSRHKNFLACCTSTDNNTAQWIDLENDLNSSFSLKPSTNLKFQ